MTIEFLDGCLLEAFDKGEVNAIGHCCNAQGKMNSGIAKQIREKYPDAYFSYMKYYEANKIKSKNILGDICGANIGCEGADKIIYNMIGQEFYGYNGRRYLNYGALGHCLQSVSERTDHIRSIIGFPSLMGCDRAGGDFSIVLEMIAFYFKEHNVRIYRLIK